MSLWRHLGSLQPLKPLKTLWFSCVFAMSTERRPGPLWAAFGRPRPPKMDPRDSNMSTWSSPGAPKTPQVEPQDTKMDPNVPRSEPKGAHNALQGQKSEPEGSQSEQKEPSGLKNDTQNGEKSVH